MEETAIISLDDGEIDEECLPELLLDDLAPLALPLPEEFAKEEEDDDEDEDDTEEAEPVLVDECLPLPELDGLDHSLFKLLYELAAVAVGELDDDEP